MSYYYASHIMHVVGYSIKKNIDALHSRISGANKALFFLTLLVLFSIYPLIFFIWKHEILSIIGNFRPTSLYSTKLTNPLYKNDFPKIEADFNKTEAVKEAFLHGWNAYKKYCWGQDEYVAVGKCSNNLRAGLTIIDSLTTLYLMNLTKEFEEARIFIDKDFIPLGEWSIFEFIIRYIGSFISTYEMTGDGLFLHKAIEYAYIIHPLMGDGIFFAKISFWQNETGLHATIIETNQVTLADTSSFQLEFARLSAITGDDKYITLAIQNYITLWTEYKTGLISQNFESFGFLSIGSGSDSYYEYIIKTYIMINGVSKKILEKYCEIVSEIKKFIVFHFKDLIGVTGYHTVFNQQSITQEHLETFVGGMLAVGAVIDNPKADEDFQLASNLTESFYKIYERMKTGLAPDQVDFDIVLTPHESAYMLRPETVESICVMWKFTGLEKWRRFAWDIFTAINKYARRSEGFSWVADVDDPDDTEIVGPQESFFFAETLKYLYLTFADSSLISPAEWVFNTEAHSLRIFSEEETKKWSNMLMFDI